MRRALIPILLSTTAALLTSTLPAQRPGGGRRNFDPDSVKLENLTFKVETFHSDAIGTDVPYGIYLPKDYGAEANKDTKWPLLIWLHGMFEDHLRFHGRGGAPVLDQAVGDGKLPPCIFVCPDGGRTSMYFNRKDKKYEDLITKDLLAHLAKTYRVEQAREQRAILGVSMGGMAALRIAFTQPDLFCAVGAHSAAVFPEDPEQLPEGLKRRASQFGLDEVFGNPIQKEAWEKANPVNLALHLEPKDLHGLRIYFDAGTEDRYGFDAGNRLLHQVLEKRGVDHQFRLIEGGGHSWGANFQEETLPFSFAAIGEALRQAGARKQGLQGLGGALGGKGDGDGKHEERPKNEPPKSGK